MDILTIRLFQDKLGELEARTVAGKVSVSTVQMDGFESCFVQPSVKQSQGVILYMHGGGYVSGNLKYAVGFASVLAAETGKSVLGAAYRLAPENPYPAALEDALASYEYLLENGYAPKDISFVGESAGGGLIFALCLLLKQKSMPLPHALVGISPWTDLTCSGQSHKTNKKKDPTLTEKLLRNYAAAYAKGNEKDPLVSPLFGDLSGFPPSLLFAGSEEVLLDDAAMLARRLELSGSQCEFVVEEGLWHVYVLFKNPEANAALKKIRGFLEQGHA